MRRLDVSRGDARPLRSVDPPGGVRGRSAEGSAEQRRVHSARHSGLRKLKLANLLSTPPACSQRCRVRHQRGRGNKTRNSKIATTPHRAGLGAVEFGIGGLGASKIRIRRHRATRVAALCLSAPAGARSRVEQRLTGPPHSRSPSRAPRGEALEFLLAHGSRFLTSSRWSRPYKAESRRRTSLRHRLAERQLYHGDTTLPVHRTRALRRSMGMSCGGHADLRPHAGRKQRHD